jgi:DNA-binding transcriptional MerR regulator
MAGPNPIRKTAAQAPEIPDKLYFRIGDVARLCEVPAYVLRFWETEFPQLKPNKGGTGQRLYRRRDVEIALRIKSLLYDQGYTIPGARQVFKTEGRGKEPMAAPVAVAPEAAMPAPTPMPVREPQAMAPVASMTTLRRDAALQLLRDDLRALAVMLARPAGTEAVPKMKLMRPRLVEARPERTQGDLFSGE